MQQIATIIEHGGNSRKILVVLHQTTSSAGRVGQLLQQAGFTLDIRRPVIGDRLPSTMDNHAGAIIFGGPMSANDSSPFIQQEADWIAVPLREKKPFLGICLGAQMLATQIGGRVAPRVDGAVEMGWYPISATAEGQKVMDWPDMVYHFHREGIYDLPSSARILAKSDAYPIQAFCYGEQAWGVQFHAELTRVMMQRWTVHGAQTLATMKGAQAPQAHLDGRFIYDAPLRQWLIRFLEKIFIQQG